MVFGVKSRQNTFILFLLNIIDTNEKLFDNKLQTPSLKHGRQRLVFGNEYKALELLSMGIARNQAVEVLWKGILFYQRM